MKTASMIRILCTFAACVSATASATLWSEPLGTAAPPGSLGGYTMDSFFDAQPLGVEVTEVVPPGSAPVTGNLVFGFPVTHLRAGSGWGTWSHGYAGDVYSFDELFYGSTLSLTLPGGTKAFYLYAEPDFFDTFTFRVTSGSETEDLDIAGEGGAQGVGFYTDSPGTESLLSVLITRLPHPDPNSDWPGFAVGEFGINNCLEPQPPPIPDGSIPPLLVGAVLFAMGAVRRWSKG